MQKALRAGIENISSFLTSSHKESTNTTQPDVEQEHTKIEGVSRKRSAEAALDDPEIRLSKAPRLQAKSEDEKRLFPDYKTPKNAMPIAIPGGEGDMHVVKEIPLSGRGASVAGRVSRPGGRAWKPQNTLSAQPHAVNGGRPNRGSGAMSNGHQMTALKRGPPSAHTQMISGDGFEGHERSSEPRNKRQKLDLGPPTPPKPAMPIDAVKDVFVDLTSEQHGTGIVGTKITKVNGRSISLPLATDYFAHNEFKNVDNRIRSTEPKAVRKSRDGRPSDRASSRGTPGTSHGSQGGSVVVVEDETLHAQHGKAPPRSRTSEQSAPIEETIMNVPAIDLTHNFDKRPLRSEQIAKPVDVAGDSTQCDEYRQRLTNPSVRPQKKAQQAELAVLSDTRDASRKDPFGKAKKAAVNAHAPPVNRGTEKSHEPTSEPNVSKYGKARPMSESRRSPSLSKTFVRDIQSPTIAQPSVKPKATVRRTLERTNELPRKVSPISDSPDELAGDDNPLSSRRRREVPPTPDPLDRRAGADWARTTADFAKRLEKRRPRLKENQVIVRAFYTASCMLNSGDIRLQYNPGEDYISVLHNGNMVPVPGGKERMVAISDEDVNKAFWDKTHRELKLCLTGPKGTVSNGHMCIVFESKDDLNMILDTLGEMTGSRLATQGLEHEKLIQTFQNHCRIVEHDFKQLQKRAVEAEYAKRSAAVLDSNVRSSADHVMRGIVGPASQNGTVTRRQAIRQNSEDDERIIYEHENGTPAPRHQLRSSGSSRSKYFGGPLSPELPRRSQREPASVRKARPPTPPPRKWTQANNLKPWSQSVVYPNVGPKRVTVDFQDLERLDEDEFLNDNIVGFSLRQIQENMSPKLKRDVFFFNTFFYTALTTKDGKKAFNYDAVKRWTKNDDLMSTPYVVVPINVHLHWFVAIICNLPNIDRKAAAPGLGDRGDDGHGNDAEVQQDISVIDSQYSAAMEELSLSDPNRSSPAVREDVQDEHPTPGTRKRQSKKKKGPGPRIYEPDTPMIITLDSFGSQHTTESRFLKDYIVAEAREKRGIDVTREDIKSMTAKGIPHQENFSDCGIYVIRYLEEFAKDPRQFVTNILGRQMGQEVEFASFKPSAKREQIRNELLRLQKEQEDARQAVKKPVKKVVPPVASPTQQPSSTALPEAPKQEGTSSVPPTKTTSLPTASISSRSQDVELEIAMPRALGQRTSEQPEIGTAAPIAGKAKTAEEQDEMLEPSDDGDQAQFQRELEQFASLPPAEVPESQEVA